MNTYKSEEWDKWMQAALQGDKAAYTQLLTHFKSWLTAYFSKRIGPEHIDDLVQETLMSVHTKRHTYDPTKPVGPWLSAIARYKWIDVLRASKAGLMQELNEETLSAPSHIEGILAKHDVNTLLKKLPAKQARLIQLVKIQGLSISVAAKHTGQSESAVKVSIHRGIKKLMTHIEERTS